MRPALLPVLLVAAADCRPSTPHEASAPPPPQGATPPAARPEPPAARAAPAPVAARIQLDAKQTECVDRWLKGHGLDDYGNPQGTMYAGGTPTFDETTGRSVDRWTLVAKNRPEALQSCAVRIPP
ncbi:MAG TPA: hypothetical protein VFN45_10395 [Myxococcaceae bacterium]|nr:hypothetical protein [Myxococcaceae bacterium]